MNRKTFLQQTGMLAAASLLSPAFGRAASFTRKNTGDIGLQLYTVGPMMDADPKGTLQKLAAIGYKNLESAGGSKGLYYGFKPKEFAGMAKDMGMTRRTAHAGGALFTATLLMI